MDCTIYVAKTKALISFAVTAKLICVLVFAYVKSRFSHDEAQMLKKYKILFLITEELADLTCKLLLLFFRRGRWPTDISIKYGCKCLCQN